MKLIKILLFGLIYIRCTQSINNKISKESSSVSNWYPYNNNPNSQQHNVLILGNRYEGEYNPIHNNLNSQQHNILGNLHHGKFFDQGFESANENNGADTSLAILHKIKDSSLSIFSNVKRPNCSNKDGKNSNKSGCKCGLKICISPNIYCFNDRNSTPQCLDKPKTKNDDDINGTLEVYENDNVRGTVEVDVSDGINNYKNKNILYCSIFIFLIILFIYQFINVMICINKSQDIHKPLIIIEEEDKLEIK